MLHFLKRTPRRPSVPSQCPSLSASASTTNSSSPSSRSTDAHVGGRYLVISVTESTVPVDEFDNEKQKRITRTVPVWSVRSGSLQSIFKCHTLGFPCRHRGRKPASGTYSWYSWFYRTWSKGKRSSFIEAPLPTLCFDLSSHNRSKQNLVKQVRLLKDWCHPSTRISFPRFYGSPHVQNRIRERSRPTWDDVCLILSLGAPAFCRAFYRRNVSKTASSPNRLSCT